MSDMDLQSEKSRQKSCNACVRSKRRCDKRTPRCTRCAEKKVDCVYQNLPGDGLGGIDDQPDEPAAMEVDPALDHLPPSGLSGSLPEGFDLGMSQHHTPSSLSSLETLVMSSSHGSLNLDMPFEYSPLSFLQDPMSLDLSNLNMELWQPPAPAPAKEPQLPALQMPKAITDDEFSSKKDVCVSLFESCSPMESRWHSQRTSCLT